MNKLLKTLALFVSSLALLPATALAQLNNPQGVGNVGVAQGGLIPIVIQVINILLSLAGLVAVIYLIYGGFRYITSRGDEDEAAEAKNVIIYAIIGLIVIGISAVIVRFIIGAVFGQPGGL